MSGLPGVIRERILAFGASAPWNRMNEVEPGPWQQGGQTLPEFERGDEDMSSSIFIGAFQLQHDITGAVECEPFVGDSGAGDVAAQLLKLIALIQGTPYLGVEAEPL